MADLKLADINGVAEITARKLKERGLNTVQDVAEADVAYISSTTGFPRGRSEAVRNAAEMLMQQGATDQPTIAPEPDINMGSTKDGKKGKKEKKKKKKGKKEKKKKGKKKKKK
jgi:predicted RecB family nuclease